MSLLLDRFGGAFLYFNTTLFGLFFNLSPMVSFQTEEVFIFGEGRSIGFVSFPEPSVFV